MSQYTAYLKKMMLFFVLLFAFVQNVSAACPTGSSGDGSGGNPCQITTSAQLQAINANATSLGHSYKLMNDINLAGVTWTPIGSSTAKFIGTFDGDGYEISNLTITKTASDNELGLFGYINGGTIKNVGMVNTTISAGRFLAALVGRIENGSTITHCYATNVNLTGERGVAGLIGYINGTGKSIIEDSYATGVTKSNGVTGAAYNGGLIGLVEGSGADIRRAYADVDVFASVGSRQAGGLVGMMAVTTASTIEDSYALGDVYGKSDSALDGNWNGVGGFIGLMKSGVTTINRCYSAGDITENGNTTAYTHGFVGSQMTGTITNSFWDVTTSGLGSSGDNNGGATGKTTTLMKTATTFTNATWSMVGTSGYYPKLFMAPAATTWRMANGVAYNSNGAISGTVPNGHITGNIATNSGTLAKTGYTFIGWNTAKNGSGTSYATGATYNYSSDLLLYAQWGALSTVTYNANGATSGTVPASQIKTYDVNLTLLASNTGNLAKTGYKFVGWNTSSIGTGANYSANDTTVYSTNSNLTLYANWQANKTVSFYVPTFSESQSVPSGTKAIKPSDPTRSGFTFDMWSKDMYSAIEYDFDNLVTSNLSLYARWNLATYPITYDPNGAESGSAPSTTIKTYGTNTTLATNSGALQKAGFKFVGWNTSADGTGTDYAVGATYSTDAALTLFAKWSAVTPNNTAPEFVIEGDGDISMVLNKIVAGDRAPSDYFGNAVAISGDTAIVGVYGEDEDVSGNNNKNDAGSAYIFTKQSNGTWTQTQKIVASDRAQDDRFGYSVSISGDTVIVGAYQEDEDASGKNTKRDAGSAYIFTKTDGTWTQTQKIVASDRAIADTFGYSVSISGDKAIIGSMYEDEDASGRNLKANAGSAYIFTKQSNGTWTQTQKIVPSDRAQDDRFGQSVSISGDKAIVGTMYEDEDTSGVNTKDSAGSAYIFTEQSDGTWTQTQKIVASDRNNYDFFGSSVAISGDSVVIGAYGEDEDTSGVNTKDSAGSAYIFTEQSDGTWTQTQKIVASVRALRDNFGYSVSISGDKVIVGALYEDEDANDKNFKISTGSAYIFMKQSDGSWSQTKKIVASDRAANDFFGSSVAIDGNNSAVGAPYVDYDVTGANKYDNAGAVHIVSMVVGPALSYKIDVNENSKVAFQAVAIDEGDIISYSISGTDAGLLDINSTTGLITFKIKPDYEIPTDSGANNVYEFVLSASDGTNTTVANAQVTVKDVARENYLPIMGMLANYEKSPNFSDFNVSLILNDTEEDNLTLTLTNSNPSMVSITENYTNPLEYSSYSTIKPTFTISSKPNIYGKTTISVKAEDPLGASDSKSFTITVPAVLNFPSMANEKIELGEDFGTFELTLTGIDLAGATSGIVATSLNSSENITVSNPTITINGSEATIIFSSALNKSGSAIATIGISANGQTVQKDINITVMPINDAPTISNTPSNGTETLSYSWSPIPIDPDSSTFTFDAYDLPSWATINTTTGEITGTPTYDDSGITPFKFIISDESISTALDLNLTVINTNRAPTAIDISFLEIEENALDINMPFMMTTDLDSDDNFTYSFCGTDYNLFSFNDDRLTTNANLNYEGRASYELCIRASDGGASIDGNFTLTITDQIEDFTITYNGNGENNGSVAPQTRIEDTNATIQDSGDLAKLSYVFDGWNTQADGTGTSYPVGSTYDVDADITLYAQWRFVNTPATFSSTPETNATQGSLYTYILSGADVNNFDTLTFGGKDISSWLRLKSIGDTVTTFAGTGVSGATDGNTSVARFYNPNNIAIDKNKNFYIADNSCIKKIDTSMNVTTFAGSCTTKGFVNAQGSSARFNAIKGIVINSQGDLIVLDNAPSNALRKITPDGNVTTYATTGTTIGTVIRGSGIEIDKDNIIYLANDAHNLISKVTTNGVITLFAGGTSGASGFSDGTIPNVTFNAPTDVTIDKDGNVFVADSKNKAIRKIDTNGNVTTIKTDVGIVTGIDVDSIGNLYFVTDLYKVYKYDIDDKQLTLIAGVDKGFADGDALTVAKFIGAKGIKVGNDGALYVADTSGYRIRKIASAGMQLVGTPTNAEVGEHNVTLLINDGTDTTEQTFTITVANINDKPTLKSKSMVVSENAAIGKVVGNIDAIDIDVGDSLTYAITAGDTNGDFSIDGDGNITVAKILNAYTKSKYTLTVKATDSSNTYATATVTITLTDEADAPVAVADSGSINEDGSITITLTTNDTDRDNNLNIGSVVVKTQPTNGTVKIDTLGKALYTPNKDFNGADSFSYLIYDKTGLESNEANVTVTINPVNDTPIVKGSTLQTDEDTNVTISLNQYTSDVDGDNLTYIITSQPTHGTISQNGAEFIYTPNLNYYGSDSFSYKVNDGTIDSLVAKIYINIAEINDVPVANVDEADTNEDTAISINVLANDIDDEGFEPATVEVLNAPLHGTTTINPTTGAITYTPEANWYGTDTFEYVVSDNGTSTNHTGAKLISNNALVIVRVASVNDAPVLVASDVNMSEDDTMRINLIANASDVDNILDGNISITANPTHGTVELQEDGVVIYSPTENYSGTDSFTYKVSDGELWSNEVAVTLNVANVNDAPSLSKLDDVTKDEDFANFTLTINGQDIDSSNLTYSATSSDTTIANVTMSGNELTISSVANAYGSVTIDVNVTDGNLSTLRSFELNVTSVFDAPTYTNQTMVEEGTLSINLTPSTLDDGNITYSATSSDESKATVSIVNGKLVVTPVANAYGTITVTLNATANGQTVAKTFTLDITNVNDAPTFTTTPITTATEDTTYNYTLGGTDVDPLDKLTFAGKNLPNWLSVQPLSSQTVLVAGQNISGYIDGNGATAKFTDMTGMVKDSSGNFYVADYGNHCIRKIDTANNVTTFAGVCTSYGFANDANRSLAKFYYPTDIVIDSQGNFFITDTNNNAIRKIDVNGSVSTFAGGSTGATDGTGTLAKFNSPQFLTIDKDDTLYLSDNSNHTIRKITKEGVVTTFAGTAGVRGNVDGVGTAAKFYKPRSIAINSQGVLYVVDSFNKAIRTIATDGTVATLKSGETYYAVAVDSNDVVHYALPTAIYKLDANKVAKQISINGKVTYPTKILFDGNSIYYPNSISLHTIYKIEGSGYKLTGKPTNDHVGENNVTVVVNDGTDTIEQNFTITVANTNDFPTIAAQSFITSENNATGSFVGKVVANDVDVGDSLTYSFISGNENGDFTIDGATGEITIAKPLNAYLASKYSLATKVTDESGAYTGAFVTVTIADEADAPVAVADSGSINEDEIVTINLARNDTDRDNNLNWGSIVLKTQPTNGTVKIDTLGVATYTPNKDFNGVDSYSYVIYDKTGLESNEANVTVTINPVNDAPVAKGTTLYTQEDTNLSIMMGNYASDVDMDELTTTIVTNPTHGTLSLEDGIYTFVPTTNFYGFDKFTYRVNDGISDSTTQTIYINVAEINDIPVAQFDDANTSEDTSVNINVLANDTDDGGLNPSTLAILNQPTNGQVTVESNGTITYTPNLNFFGSDSFSYTVKDDGVATGTQGTGVLISNEAIVNITINPVNDAPVLVASDVNMSEDDTMRINLIANASDVDNILDGNISITANPANGTIDILENGVIVYNPTANWNGTDSFTYKVSDGELWSNVVTMTLNVANVNDAPSLVKPANLSKDEDFANFTITINAQDIDSSTLTYSATSSDTTIATVSMSGNLLTISSVANAYGSVMVDINVSDGNLTITRNFELNVTGIDDAPIFTQITSKTFSEDGVFEMNLVASDLEGQTITYTASSSDTTKATVSIVDGKLVVTPLADAFGTITVEVNATANGLTTTQTFTVVIEALNDAPIMQTINNLIVYKDSGDRNITIGATDIDSVNLTYSAVAANPDLVTLGWSGNILKVTPKETQVGTTNITVMVSDGDKNTTKTFQLQILQIVANDAVKDSGVVTDTNESIIIRFEADDITITAPKGADENGTIEHKISIGEIEIISTSELNGSVVAVTDSGVKTTYEDNTTNVTVEIEGLVTGEATHSLDLNGTKIEATSQIIGAKTTVKKDVNDKIIIETKVTDSNNTTFDVVAKEDGTASHKVTLSNGNESSATSKIKGARTTIKQTGGVETEVINKPTTCTGEYVKAIVMTQADGKAFTKFVRYNCTDNSEIGEMITNTQTTPYAPNNSVTIESNNGSTQIITVTPLEDNIKF